MSSPNQREPIIVVGAGYVGLAIAVGFVVPGHDVAVVFGDGRRIDG